MLKFIILSEDSAFNTHLFLQGLKNHVIGDFSATVIYKASTPDYSLMYETVLNEFSDTCDFVKTENFKKQILTDLEERTSQDFVCFCTSEDLFYRPFVIPNLEEVFSNDKILSFQTRLGKNIKKNTSYGSENIFKPENDDKVLVWDWSVHYVDFGEPFSIHGSIYRKKEIQKIIKKIPFESREELEEGFGMFGNYNKNKLACYKTSSLLTQQNDSNPKTAHLTKMLTNIKLMKGERFKLSEFETSKTEEIYKDIGVTKLLTNQKIKK